MSTIDLAEMTALLKRRTDTARMRVVDRIGTNDPWEASVYSFSGYYEVVVDDDGGPDIPWRSIAEVYRWWNTERWHASWRQNGGHYKFDHTFSTPVQALREAIASWRHNQKVKRQ